MSTFTYTDSFTETHAAHLAGRVTTDLRHSFLAYGSPSESMLEQFLQELKVLLSNHYVSKYHFGFENSAGVIWGLKYVFNQHGDLTAESDVAGGVPHGHNVSGANFFNHMEHSANWYALSSAEQAAIEASLPFVRGVGVLPGAGTTVWAEDRTFNAGGIGAQRFVAGGTS